MTVTLHSTRFGDLEIPDEQVIEFPTGLIGLPGHRYALLARQTDSAFIWLHSLDDGDLAIPVTNPWRFFGDYEVLLSDDETERLGIDEADPTSVYVTVRAAAVLEEFCANLAAPILISGRTGHQIINQAGGRDGFPVRAPLLAGIAGEGAQAA